MKSPMVVRVAAKKGFVWRNSRKFDSCLKHTIKKSNVYTQIADKIRHLSARTCIYTPSKCLLISECLPSIWSRRKGSWAVGEFGDFCRATITSLQIK